ncbi:MAG TPA: hypothetical protein VN822_02760 [Candidatus Acidoferrales bacterium]|nr:hypothetical protein [Candidatus Acidoferrales bacterium]
MIRIWGPFVAAALLACSAFPQDRIEDLRARFAREPNPVQRAKLMPQLGEEEFRKIGAAVAAGRLPDAVAILNQYRSEVQLCEKGLEASGIDAEKHSAGFKQLEISLRETWRDLDELIVGLPRDEQAPFVDARQELSEVSQRLMRKLFPHEPPGDAKPGKTSN